MKTCYKCKRLCCSIDFHKQGQRRHSWCRDCFNAYQRERRVRKETPEQKRRQNLKYRYGISLGDAEVLLAKQGGKCQICKTTPKRTVIDHCHVSGKVRGILCHRCNILIGGWDDVDWRTAALEYLEL